jgi:predicted PurR-regulated permease PerM
VTPALQFLIAQHGAGTAQTAHEFSQSMTRHAMAATHSSGEVILVVAGAIIVLLTTLYMLVYLVRPGEEQQDHIKRRILDEGHEGLG